MKKYIFSEELGNIGENYIEEVLLYQERRHKMKSVLMNVAAIAACLALVIGVGAAALARGGSEPNTVATSDQTLAAEISSLTKEMDIETVEVEKSYNERIADGEDVSIETYVGIPYRISSEKYSVVGDFTYTLQSVSISDRLPEGITKDDLDVSIGPVREYSEDGVKAYSTEDGKSALDISEFLDENGVYTGPGNG